MRISDWSSDVCSSDLKIRDVVAKLAPSTTARLMNEEDTLTDSFRKEGMVVTLPTEADVNKAIAMITPYWEQWAQQQGPKLVQALQKVRKVLNRGQRQGAGYERFFGAMLALDRKAVVAGKRGEGRVN